MGWRYRKSINIGAGFRINISKSGIGYSWGVPGYRVTKTANGKTRHTASIPGTGISYIQESGTRNKPQSSGQSAATDIQNISTDDVEQITSASLTDISTAIERAITCNIIGNWLVVIGILGIGYFPLLLAWIPAIVCKVLARKKYAVQIEYKFEDGLYDDYAKKMAAWSTMLSSEKVWQITQRGHAERSRDNGGAKNIINRKQLAKSKSNVFWLNSNITPIYLKLDREALVVFPDMILLIRGHKAGAVSIEDIDITTCSVRYVESATPPKDTQIVKKTWLHVNNDGSPDRRFKKNPQYPVCLYGQIDIKSRSGVNIQLQCSNPKKIEGFQ